MLTENLRKVVLWYLIVSIYVKPPLNKARKEILMPFTWKKRNEEKKKILRQSHVKFDSKRGLKKRHVMTMTMTFPTCHFSIALLSICNNPLFLCGFLAIGDLPLQNLIHPIWFTKLWCHEEGINYLLSNSSRGRIFM